jgi:osmotically-inducible protein OsmY
MATRGAHWLLIASMLALGGCVAAVIGGSGSGTAGAPAAGSATVSPDSRITAAVQGRLAADPLLKGLAIAVATRGGAVTLAGTVRSSAQRAAAERAARTVDGVTSVTNTVTVK